jgi:hypothetical protein
MAVVVVNTSGPLSGLSVNTNTGTNVFTQTNSPAVSTNIITNIVVLNTNAIVVVSNNTATITVPAIQQITSTNGSFALSPSTGNGNVVDIESITSVNSILFDSQLGLLGNFQTNGIQTSPGESDQGMLPIFSVSSPDTNMLFQQTNILEPGLQQILGYAWDADDNKHIITANANSTNANTFYVYANDANWSNATYPLTLLHAGQLSIPANYAPSGVTYENNAFHTNTIGLMVWQGIITSTFLYCTNLYINFYSAQPPYGSNYPTVALQRPYGVLSGSVQYARDLAGDYIVCSQCPNSCYTNTIPSWTPTNCLQIYSSTGQYLSAVGGKTCLTFPLVDCQGCFFNTNLGTYFAIGFDANINYGEAVYQIWPNGHVSEVKKFSPPLSVDTFPNCLCRGTSDYEVRTAIAFNALSNQVTYLSLQSTPLETADARGFLMDWAAHTLANNGTTYGDGGGGGFLIDVYNPSKGLEVMGRLQPAYTNSAGLLFQTESPTTPAIEVDLTANAASLYGGMGGVLVQGVFMGNIYYAPIANWAYNSVIANWGLFTNINLAGGTFTGTPGSVISNLPMTNIPSIAATNFFELPGGSLTLQAHSISDSYLSANVQTLSSNNGVNLTNIPYSIHGALYTANPISTSIHYFYPSGPAVGYLSTETNAAMVLVGNYTFSTLNVMLGSAAMIPTTNLVVVVRTNYVSTGVSNILGGTATAGTFGTNNSAPFSLTGTNVIDLYAYAVGGTTPAIYFSWEILGTH